MKKLIVCIALALAIGPVHAAGFPEIAGWSPTGDSMTFTPDTLWEQINGAAETFLQYGFRNLETAELKHGETVVSVGIYEMGSPRSRRTRPFSTSARRGWSQPPTRP